MKKHIELCGRKFEIVNSPRRKRIAIGVDSSGNWFIGVPQYCTGEYLLKILADNTETAALIKRLEKKTIGIPPARTYREGEELFLRGERFPLRWNHTVNSPPVELREGIIYISSERRGREAETLEIWYRKQLYHILREVLPHWTKRMGVAPPKIDIKNVKTLWGSCSASGRITFSARLALVPQRLLEYVIIHELTHIRHLNHSEKFWLEVGTYLSDYKERRSELKKNGYLYQWQ